MDDFQYDKNNIKLNILLKAEIESILNSFKFITVSSVIVVVALFFINEEEDPRINNTIPDKTSFTVDLKQGAADICLRFIVPFIFVLLHKFNENNTILIWLGKICYFLAFFFAAEYYILKIFHCYGIPYPPILLFIISCITVIFGIFGIRAKNSEGFKKIFTLITLALLSVIYINFAKHYIFWFLGSAAIMDGVSVLCSWGPLNIFLRRLKSQNEKIPNEFVYSLNEEEVSNNLISINNNENNMKNIIEIEITERNLGCGDIFFISILIGYVSLQNDWISSAACYFAVLIGLAITFLCFTVFNRDTLPALPIPIFFGIITYFLMKEFGTPLINEFVMREFII